jgi:two-component system, OmpR family, osmolarity sensor histidine kinase EnvZ
LSRAALEWVVVTVRDYGPGVAPEKMSQLTTLGLAIVKKAPQRLGGSLELANATDGGLIVHIRLKRV